MSERLVDPEIAAAFYAIVEERAGLTMPERGDWKGLRELGEAVWPEFGANAPVRDQVRITDYFANVGDGASIKLRWYDKIGHAPGSAVVYAHGGGMIANSADSYDFVVSEYVDKTGVPFLSVDYRRAPEAQGTRLAEDVFAGLSWLIGKAPELGVDPMRVALMGDSGGGGVAAGAAILARDRKIPLAVQMLIYPMLDDRNLIPDPSLVPWAFWTYDNNYTGWNAVLGADLGTDSVSPVAAPGRLTDFDGLARAYIEVGDLDIFRDESIAYAMAIGRAGAAVELHVHAGAPHGYDQFAKQSALSRRAISDRLRVIATL